MERLLDDALVGAAFDDLRRGFCDAAMVSGIDVAYTTASSPGVACDCASPDGRSQIVSWGPSRTCASPSTRARR